MALPSELEWLDEVEPTEPTGKRIRDRNLNRDVQSLFETRGPVIGGVASGAVVLLAVAMVARRSPALDSNLVFADGVCQPTPLARRVSGLIRDPGAFTDRIDELARLARERNPSSYQRRNFGYHGDEAESHEVTYLQSFLATDDPKFVNELWRLTKATDPWLQTPQSRLQLRCAELIEYHSSRNHSLQMHTDGETAVSVAVLLNQQGVNFEGGELEIHRHGHGENGTGLCSETHAADRGDVITWRGWDSHRVKPITEGRRKVLGMTTAHARVRISDRARPNLRLAMNM